MPPKGLRTKWTAEHHVRLFIATIAAYPDLKLNYREIARMFGQNSTRDSIYEVFKKIKRDAKLLAAEAASREPAKEITLQASNPKKRAREEKPPSPRRDHKQREGERATQKVKIEEDDEGDEAWKFISENEGEEEGEGEEEDNSHLADKQHAQEEVFSRTEKEKNYAVDTAEVYEKYCDENDEVSYIYIH